LSYPEWKTKYELCLGWLLETGAHRALRPQRIAIAEPFGGGDELDARVHSALDAGLRRLGYEVALGAGPSDATLRFYVDEPSTGRARDSGAKRARIELSAELLGRTGVLWEGTGSRVARDGDEDDTRHDGADLLVGTVVDGVADARNGEFREVRRFEPGVHDARTDACGSVLVRLASSEVWSLAADGGEWTRLGTIEIPPR
jgi:hypothetical protein